MTGERTQIVQGMLVVLKSGGPAMTVRAISGDHAYCDWFAGTERRQGTFQLVTLQPADADRQQREDQR
jgi:uncharacterized protein YodC (DUF2158 family)